MKEYLSIGEFSKLSGLTIKALRYYDKIGVLKPDYVSKESLYRYYSRNQLRIAELIMTSVILDLPLSFVKENFIKDNRIHYESYLTYAEKRLQERIAELKDNLSFVQSTSDCVKRQKIEKMDSYTPFMMEKTSYLLTPFDKDIDSFEFDLCSSKLFEEYSAEYKEFNYTYGVLLYQKRKYIFAELKNRKFAKKKKEQMILTLEKGEYEAKLTKNTRAESLSDSFYMISQSLLSNKDKVYEIIRKKN